MQRLSYLLRPQIMILLFTYNGGKLPILTLLVLYNRRQERGKENNRGVVQVLNL